MKKIILSMIIATSSTLFANSELEYALKTESNFKVKNRNDLRLAVGPCNRTIKKLNSYEYKPLILGTTSLYSRTNIRYKDNLDIRISPFAYIYTNNKNEKLKNPLTETNYEFADIFFRELYVKYYITKKHSIGAGIVPFSDNAFKEYQSDSNKKGDGLNILLDIDTPTLFYAYEPNPYVALKIGYGVYNWMSDIPKGNYLNSNVSSSKVLWSLLDIRDDKFQYYYQIIHSNAKYKSFNAGKIYLMGVGASYNDSDNTGISLYGSIGASIYKNNTAHIKNQILSDNHIEPKIVDEHPESFGFNNKTYYGYSGLFGARYDFELDKNDVFVVYEYFKTKNDWFSFNNGTFYKSTFNATYNISHSDMFIIGSYLNNDTLIKLAYTNNYYDNAKKIGAPAASVSLDAFSNPALYEKNCLKLEISFSF